MKKIAKYRKKPIEIEAIQYLGYNINEIIEFCGESFQADIYNPRLYEISGIRNERIMTLEGVMNVTYGDFIIKGIEGEFYPCKSHIFFETYELVE
ncbi:MAG: hypothetical protein FWC41_00225 [Firmicutes bacterium]|nr:hypothetical protein [Bacillota bacterium]